MATQFLEGVKRTAESHGLACEPDGFRTMRITREDGEFANVVLIDAQNPDDKEWCRGRWVRSGWVWRSTVADGTSSTVLT
ncbi:hypothetical protein LA324_05315 [Corynebacterium coyleae]|uniref:hypothetical protein n=1 Tax=Corynebacterium coyleae TaxID=53374 RepID=UPI001CC94812|nr:hypothetical protein [Corynebacterium coyleae]UBI10029.1 hypothetical protein LA324_05315 [Corynebacterium coyleae]